MNDLKITGSSDTFFTPNVDFNGVTGVCSISGESYLENTIEFYKKLLDWLEEYLSAHQTIDFHFSLSYFNTTSSKSILQLLLLLKKHKDTGKEVKITWHYNPDDEDMREEAEDYELDSGLKLTIVGDLITDI
jgi:hypothetical protein